MVSSVNGQTGVVSIGYADLAGSIPTWNQNTTGTAAGLSATLAIGSGGTGQTTAGAAFNALSPITTTGDLIIGNGTNSATRLGIGANGYLLSSNGTTASWQPAPAGGVTTFDAGTTGFTPSTATSGAISLAGTLVVSNGGTGATTLTGYVKGTGTSALTASSTIPNTDISGLGTMSTQNANSVAVTGGAVDGTTIGATTASTVKATTVTTTGTGSPSDGAGQVYLNGATSNRVEWSAVGTGAPAFTTRSAGTKALLYPAISGSQVDYAIGIDAATLWNSVPVASSSFYFKWFGGETQVASMDGTGAFTATSFAGAGTGLTGTASSLSIGGNAATATSATTATNLAGGAASQIPYQTGSGATSFIANGTAGQVLTSAGASAPAWGGINGGTF